MNLNNLSYPRYLWNNLDQILIFHNERVFFYHHQYYNLLTSNVVDSKFAAQSVPHKGRGGETGKGTEKERHVKQGKERMICYKLWRILIGIFRYWFRKSIRLHAPLHTTPGHYVRYNSENLSLQSAARASEAGYQLWKQHDDIMSTIQGYIAGSC